MIKNFKRIKGITIALLVISIIFSLTSCGEKHTDITGKDISPKDEQYVSTAIKKVQDAWKQEYQNLTVDTDKTVNIINTRIIKIKDNDHKFFHDVEAVVEFDIFSDYYGSAPYYINGQKNDSVVFHKNGKTEVIDPLNPYRYALGINDYSDVIGEIIELGSAFNTQTKTVELDSTKEKYVNSAIEELKTHWTNTLSQLESVDSDGTLKIINTRLILINNATSYKDYDKYFSGVKAIVEFELYSDYFGTAPYYINAGTDNVVWIMEDGSVKMAEHTIKNVISATYSGDFGDLFTEIDDIGSKYNATFNLLQE